MQIDSINELPEEKRPSEFLIWDGTVEALNAKIKESIKFGESKKASFTISEDEIE